MTTDPMISPGNPPANVVLTAAERSAAVMTAALDGGRRAATDLAADRKDALTVPPHRRKVDLSTPSGRIRYGYLGEHSRNALAELFETYEQHAQSRDLPVQLVAAFEDARQALRLAATVDDEQLPLCPVCAEAPAVTSVRGQL